MQEDARSIFAFIIDNLNDDEEEEEGPPPFIADSPLPSSIAQCSSVFNEDE